MTSKINTLYHIISYNIYLLTYKITYYIKKLSCIDEEIEYIK